jgi:dolichyl-phosphate beta-glucosyltransferase
MSLVKIKNKKPNYQLTIVIPSYKESIRLPIFLSTLAHVLPKEMNLIIVDDGSPKEDFQSLKDKIAPFLNEQIQLLRYEKNRGKGGAIEFGLEHTDAPWLGFLDADGSISATEVLYLWNFAKSQNNFDLVLSSRIKLLGKTIDRTFKRHFFGRIFVTYMNFLFHVPVYDSQCGYKIFRKSLYESVKNQILNKRWLWDTELVILSYKSKFNCIEIPIDWQDIPGSKISLISDSIKMALGLWEFKKSLKES